MERPQVRMVNNQEVVSTREVTGSEAEELLRKYGYSQPDQQFSTREEPVIQQPVNQGSTFEEMVSQQESKRKLEELKRKQKNNSPIPNTFDGRNGYDSEIKYSSDADTGFNFKIEINTDMKLPKY